MGKKCVSPAAIPHRGGWPPQGDDLPLLVEHYVRRYGRELHKTVQSIAPASMELIRQYSWPGNIRELQNAVERLALLSAEDEITGKDVLQFVHQKKKPTELLSKLIDETESFHEYKEEAERLFLLKKLEKYDWNVSATADAIDIQRSHIYNKMKKYDIER